MSQGYTKGIPIDVDGTLAQDSDLLVPSQKAVKTYTDTELALKENLSNKDTDGTLSANSDTKYPSQKAVKTYTDTGLATKVGTTGNESIAGQKTFTNNATINDNSANPALKINQIGSGHSILVEDSATPDSTPFVVDNAGSVGIGTTAPTHKLEVVTPAVSGAESITKFTVSDADSNLAIVNATGTASTFIPWIKTTQPTSTNVGMLIGAECLADSGTSASIVFDARKSGAALTTKPLFLFRNYTTNVMQIMADGSVGIGTTTPNAFAKVDITSTTQGFLPPRMTTAQRDAMTPVAGLMIYNSTTNKHQGYNGTTWNDFY